MSQFLNNVIPLIPLTLANLPAVAPAELGSWLISFAAVAVIAHQALGLIEKFKKMTKEQPRPAETYQTMALCQVVHKAVEQRFEDFKKENENGRKEMRIDLKGIHSRINDVFSAVDELKGQIKRMP
ncbi:MAG: hypothetical protein V2A34_02540 [Lentisphaerota bacterium]